MKRPFIMVAPNGARRGKADHPALPVSTDELVQTAAACHDAGAQGFHLHVRDDDGQHSLDPGRYRETLDELARAVPDLRLQITTESGGRFDVATQLATLRAVRPGWASVAAREIARDPDLADAAYGTCAEQRTEVQHIVYEPADLALLADWRARGVVREDQTSVIFVLGRYSPPRPARPSDLAAFGPVPSWAGTWMLCAFGPREHDCLIAAARAGGDLRVGFENSLQDGQKSPHKDNAASVAALVDRLERITA
ncbi:3-keto-5-aminohexanoate cleavage protein [Roseovarius sp. SYSU LYC5161]|uniref:3-keto-5-aminohexanoate cleavage protein n=1 Tax=Roseovarius halophilus (ex Wu et al. 2025) TaxID=3376060 RepID=UPI00399A31F0